MMTIDGVHLLDDRAYHDARGYFMETYQQERLDAVIGRAVSFVQDNLSMSHQGVIRGLHYQYQHPQAKLVRVLQGEIWDVVVDLRQSSPSFGQWHAYHLSVNAPQQLYIPEGCAHGFLTLSTHALVMYKVSDFYQPQDEYCLRYNDPYLAIAWPMQYKPILSAKDEQGKSWQELPLFA